MKLWSFEMRGSVAITVLLFFLSSATAQTSDSSIADIWNELHMLKDMVFSLGTLVVEQRLELRNLETRVRENEVQAEKERSKVLLLTAELGNMLRKVEEQKADLGVTKNRMTELEKESSVLSAVLSGIGHRVAASEKDLDNQSREVATLRGALSTTENEVQLQKIIVQHLEKAKTEQETRLNAVDLRMTANEKEAEEQKIDVMTLRVDLNSTMTELQLQNNDIEQLQKETAGKIAFSVGLTGSVGPFNTETLLKYNKIFTNVGNAYSHTLGKFIAPVRGVYYFRFTAFDHRDTKLFGLHFYRNDQKLMSNWEHNNDEGHLYLSNALTLQLNEGDLVYMQLPSGYSLFDDENNHNTFSGFLLFSV